MDITISNTTYRFPILKNAEIIECLSEAGIELNEVELTEPNRHKEKVKQVFLSLVSTTVIPKVSTYRKQFKFNSIHSITIIYRWNSVWASIKNHSLKHQSQK